MSGKSRRGPQPSTRRPKKPHEQANPHIYENSRGVGRMTDIVSCGGCGAQWTGLSACHCSSRNCHRTFSSPSAFDQHRLRGECCDPIRRGLVPVHRRYWDGWGHSGDDARWDE
jgi:hypothetical protein